jgi:hypothetical protein
MTKKVPFGAKPTAPLPGPRTAEEWVQNRSVEPMPSEPMKRLTIDVPARLHTRIKVSCSLRGRKIADEVRELLDQHFPEKPLP